MTNKDKTIGAFFTTPPDGPSLQDRLDAALAQNAELEKVLGWTVEQRDILNLNREHCDEQITDLQAQLDRANAENLQLRLPKVWEIQTGDAVSIGLRYENGAMTAIEYTEDESGNFEHYRAIELEEHTNPAARFTRATTPRPMSEAPMGVEIHALVRVRKSPRGTDVLESGYAGWLPLPDTEAG